MNENFIKNSKHINSKKFLKILLKIIKAIFKFVFLFPIYCSMPDKYDGITFEEWLKKQNLP